MLSEKLISKAKEWPMWFPRMTMATVQDIPDQGNIKKLSLNTIIIKFIFFALIVSAAGFFVAKTGMTIADKTGLSEGFAGLLFTGVATFLPELIVSLAAVRQNALTLSIGNIIGGNSFDMLL
ncbi:MAG: hypothetical protein ACLFT4_06780 [Bacteroidales bacterium]